jgi:beta-1,4-mannosyl-glycoprotein beta-1,4-N-acetylglucosaminyltransferase
MIFDCFTFFREFDLLEARLVEMSDIVDRFVLVESDRTFQGAEKPYYFEAGKARFEKYLHKIIHIKQPIDDGALPTRYMRHGVHWAREKFQRDAIARGLAQAKAGDQIIVSDVDEIIRSARLKHILGERRSDELSILEMPIFRFRANRIATERHRKAPQFRWFGPRMVNFEYFSGAEKLRTTRPFASVRTMNTIFGGPHTRFLNWMRCDLGLPVKIYTDSGWHFSSLGAWEEFRSKIDAFSHPEMKQSPLYLDKDAYTAMMMADTQDYPMEDLPAYIRQNPDKFIRF